MPGKFIHIYFAHIKVLMSPPVKDDPSSCRFSSVEEGSSQSEEASTRFTASPTQARLFHIKDEHDLAKAVKLDDTPVLVHVWNQKVFHGPPMPTRSKALAVAREGFIRHYRRRLLRDGGGFLRKNSR